MPTPSRRSEPTAPSQARAPIEHWEYPLDEMAMERGTTPEMKEAGQHLVVYAARCIGTL